MMVTVERYQTAEGKEPITDWLASMRDRIAKANILRRFSRLELGNFGDSKPIREGVIELRIDTGKGYRAYAGRHGDVFVVLLLGGDKSTQDADIKAALAYWKDWKARNSI